VSWFYRQADLCLAPSRTVVTRLTELGVARDQIAQIPRGVDLTLFHPDRRDRDVLRRWGLVDRRVVLYVGRLSKEKNLEALLDAFARVRATRPDVALLLVGDGPHAAALAALGSPDVVQTGALHGEELAAVYASADVLAFPSETETFGNVVVEAQASGLPVVVAAAGAAHEHVQQGITGLVVDGQPFELATAIATLLDDAALRARLGRAAHRFAQRHDLEVAARAGFELYRQLTSPKVPEQQPGISAMGR
jgi:glycosyltransferase involved in cell wall biosynthesis